MQTDFHGIKCHGIKDDVIALNLPHYFPNVCSIVEFAGSHQIIQATSNTLIFGT